MAEEIINQEILPVEAVTYGDTDPKPKSYWKKIHENLVDAFGAKEVPDEVTFEKKIKDPKYAKLIHDNLVDAFGATEVPDYKSFTDSLTIVSPEKKKSWIVRIKSFWDSIKSYRIAIFVYKK